MTLRKRTTLFAAIALTVIAAVVRRGSEPDAVTARDDKSATLPKFWKGNLHTHTLWSDGDDYPEMVADWYRSHGYHFLALTDHNVLSEGEKWMDENARTEKGLKKYLTRFGADWVERRENNGKKQIRIKPLAEFRSQLEEPGKFLMIQAEEISAAYSGAPVHLNGINLRDLVPAPKAASIPETISVSIRGVQAQSTKSRIPMTVFLNHPNFKWGVRAEEMIAAEELRFFEVFNGHPGVDNYGDKTHASTERIWDIVLTMRMGKLNLPIVYGVATDDAHGYHEFGVGKVNPGRGWVMVRAKHLTAESVVRAVDAGDFYCSTGVTLDDFRRTKQGIEIDIKPEAGVTYKTQFIATLKDTPTDSQPVLDKNGKEMRVTRTYSADIGKVVAEVDGTAPRYVFTGKEIYVRAKIVSSKAHPNPYAKGDTETAWIQPVTP